jgi:hypothetical protein
VGILPRAFVFVLPRPAIFANLLALSVAPAFPAAPNARFISPRESHRAEDGAALPADLAREDTVLLKEFITLLSGEQHGYSSSLCGSV